MRPYRRRDRLQVSKSGLDRTGRIVPQYAPAQASMVNAQLARLRADRIPLVPTLANVVQGQWVYRPLITDMLRSRASLSVSRASAITWLVNAFVDATPISGPAWR